MGRNKIQIKKIASTSGRQITYSKRRAGLFKKARELSILCDADVLLVVFSTKGEPSVCLGERSKFEDIIIRYSKQSPEERHKRKREVIEALRNVFKKKDPDVNIDELYDADSQLVEEAKQQQSACYRDEIIQLSNFLGPLSEFEDLKKMEDINKIIEMEQKINDFIAQIRVSKENANNYAQILQSGMNQSYQLNGELGSLQYTTPDSKQIMFPCNPRASHQRGLAKFNTSYEAPINYTAQDIIWAQMFENQQINTNELPVLMHIPTKKPLCVESVKKVVMPGNKGDVSENLNENQNRSMCQGQKETLSISAVPSEAGVSQLQEMSGNENRDLLDNFLEQKMFFRKDIVNQDVPMQDSCFQAWASGNDACFFMKK